MTVKISNRKWLQLVLEKHQPVDYDIGDQRDPTIVIICSHMEGMDRYNTAKAGFKFNDHILDVMEQELPGLLDDID